MPELHKYQTRRPTVMVSSACACHYRTIQVQARPRTSPPPIPSPTTSGRHSMPSVMDMLAQRSQGGGLSRARRQYSPSVSGRSHSSPPSSSSIACGGTQALPVLDCLGRQETGRGTDAPRPVNFMTPRAELADLVDWRS